MIILLIIFLVVIINTGFIIAAEHNTKIEQPYEIKYLVKLYLPFFLLGAFVGFVKAVKLKAKNNGIWDILASIGFSSIGGITGKAISGMITHDTNITMVLSIAFAYGGDSMLKFMTDLTKNVLQSLSENLSNKK